MTTLACTRTGAGPPLVLLHALGSSQRSWDPVIPALAAQFEVLTIDLPGFGRSEPLPANVEPTPRALAGRVADLIEELGVDAPHVAGNSLGGWVALELAGLRPVRSLTLLAPAGLWRGHAPRYNLVSLHVTRWLARHTTAALCWLVGYRAGRALVLGQTHGRPIHMSPAAARSAIYTLAECPGFDATLAATARRDYVAGATIDGPVTAAFGTRDWLLRRGSRHVDQLPPGTRRALLPGCGHLPMGDDPDAVVALITSTTTLAQSGTADRG